MTILITLLGIVMILVQYLSRKMKEEEKPRYVVVAQYLIPALIAVLGAYDQWESSSKQEAYRNAELKLDVLSKISANFRSVMDNSITIMNKFWIVRNYLSMEEARKKNPEFATQLDWHAHATPSQAKELDEVKTAFDAIRAVAADIVKFQLEYGDLIPAQTLEWANATVGIKFEDIDKYFDPYSPAGTAPKESVVLYNQLTGRAFGVVMGTIREAVHVLKEK